MDIILNYDNLSSAPAGFQAAMQYVANLYDQLFTNNITVNIDVGWGEIDGQALSPDALGNSYEPTSVYFATYSQVRSALIAQNAPGSSTLPTTDPASTSLIMTSGEEKALGIYTGATTSQSSPDGYVGFIAPTGYSFDFTPDATPSSTEFYFIGVAEHEISEVLGRGSYFDAGQPQGDTVPGSYNSLMDLYRYSAPGQRQLTEGNPSYFSINNGVTDLGDWNNYGASDNGGDLGDWADDFVNDSYDAFTGPGSLDGLSTNDITLMQALGYTNSGTPGTLWLTLSGTGSANLGEEVLGSSSVNVVDDWINTNADDPNENFTLPDGSQISQSAVQAIAAALATYQAAHPTFNPATATSMPNDPTLIAALNTYWSRAIDGSRGDDTIDGGFGSDTITGGTNDILDYVGSWTSVDVDLATGSATHGTATDSFTGIVDVVGTTSFNDTLIAGSTNDVLAGGAGDDSLVGGSGTDTITSGNGANTVSLGSGNASVGLGTGADTVTLGAGTDTITVGGGSDRFVVGHGDYSATDTITGSGHDTIQFNGTTGDSLVLNGASANLKIGTGFASLTVDATGATGNVAVNVNALTQAVTLLGNGGDDTLTGTSASNDTIMAQGGNNSIAAGAGSDSITAGNGANTIALGNGGDHVVVGTGMDTVSLGSGSDTIAASGGNDVLLVAAGADYVAADTVTLGAGTDAVRFTSAVTGDSLVLSANLTATGGQLTVEASSATGSLTGTTALKINANALTQAITLLGNAGNDTLIGTASSNDTITALAGNNSVSAGSGADSITVGNGANTIALVNGSDHVVLGTGLDTLSMGSGSETIAGSNGNDVLLVAVGSDYEATDTVTLGTGNDVVRFTSNVTNDALVLNAGLTATGGHLTIEASDASGNLTGSTALKLDARLVTQAVTLLGNTGNDTLLGTNGSNDTITAQGGGNSIVAGSGSDSITAGSGANTVALGAGSDTLSASGGNDVLLVAAGADYAATDTVTLGAGTDAVRFTSAVSGDSLTLSAGLTATGGHLTVEASDALGNVTGATALKLDAHLVNQAITLLGNTGDDTLIGTTGSNDTITAQGGKNSIVGGAGADSITAGAGADTVNAGSGNATVTVGGGADTITLGGGADSIALGTGADTVALGAGHDTVAASSGNDRFVVGHGDYSAADSITGTGNDTIQFNGTTGDSLVLNGVGGGFASLTVDATGATGNVAVDASALTSAVTMLANGGDDTLTAGAGHDTLVGGSGHDVFKGTTANLNGATIQDLTATDTIDLTNLASGSASATLSGGVLTVSSGGTTVQINISNLSASAVAVASDGTGGTDITLTAGSSATLPNPGTLWLTRSGDDLIGQVLGSAPSVDEANWFTTPVSLTLADGSTLSAAQLESIFSAETTYQENNLGFNPATASVMPNDPTLIPALNTDYSRVIAGSANQTIDGGFGSDTITGGTNDVLDYSGSWTAVSVNLATGSAVHGTATDTLTNITSVKGTTGFNDTLVAGTGSDLLAGGAGDDSLVAGGGADTITAGGGKDTVLLGAGNDSVGLGSGADAITLSTGGATITASGGNDTVLIGGAADYVSTDTLTLGAGTDVVRFTSAVSGDSLVLANTSATGGQLTVEASNAAGAVTGTTALKLSVNALTQAVALIGNAGDDTLIGTAGSNDTITAQGGNNSIVAGAGDDSITAGNGANTITLGNGSDRVFVGSGANVISLGSGSDTLGASNGNDVLLVASGADYASSDSIALGSGADAIRFTSALTGDSLVLGANLTATGGQLTVEASNATGGLTGTTALKINAAAVTQGIMLLGNAGDDTLIGTSGNDTITAQGGNNSIVAGAGTDSITAGNGANTIALTTGNDHVVVGNGPDTLSLGSGSETISASGGNDLLLVAVGSDYESTDTVSLGAGTDVVRFTSAVTGDALVLNAGFTATGPSLTIEASTATGVLTGTTALKINASALTRAITLLGNAGDDTLIGTSGSNDTITAQGGKNSILGGAGADSITAGGGADTINTGSGNATVTVGGGADTITLGNGADSVAASSGPDTVSLGSGHDTVSGGSGNDVFVIGHGDYSATDTITGTGHDTIQFNGTTGDSLVLNGAGANLEIGTGFAGLTVDATGSTGNVAVNANALTQAVTLLGNGGDDTLTGTSGSNDTITAQGGNNSIALGTGSDHVVAGSGANTVSLGTGSDTIAASGGNDVLLVAAGADYAATDTVTLGAGTDTVRFTSTLSDDSLVLNAGLTATGGQLTVEASNAAGSLTGTTALKIDAHLVTQAVKLFGNAGDDTLIGTSGSNDSITAQGANSSILAGAGDDSITAGSSGDTVTLGNGNDHVFLARGGEWLSFGSGSDTVTGSGGNDTLIVAAGADFAATDTLILGSVGMDVMRFTSTTTGDALVFNGLVDAGSTLTVEASDAAGNLTGTTALKISAQHAVLGAVSLLGNAGNDTLIGTGTGNDTIVAQGGNNSIGTGSGNDSITAGNGANIVTLSTGDDQVALGSGANSLSLGSGSDTVNAAGGNDTLIVAAGADYAATDTVALGAGADVVRFTSASAGDTLTLNGSLTGGALTIEASDASGNLTGGTLVKIDAHLVTQAVTLLGNTNNDTLIGTSGSNDTITAQGGNNSIQGGAGADSITAGGGADTINTGSGSATVNAGAGADTVTLGNGNDSIGLGSGTDTVALGAGRDTVAVGSANDVFVIGHGDYNAGDTITGSGHDTIQFNGTTGDSLVLNGSGANLDVGTTFAGLTVNGTGATGNIAINAAALSQAVTLMANGGDDTLTAGAGGDTLVGGAGSDVFRGTVADLNGSTITNFNSGDVIDLTNLSPGSATANLVGNVLTVQSGATSAQITIPGASATQLTVTADGNGGTDVSLYSDPILGNPGTLWLTRSGNNLVIETLGSASTAVAQNWFGSEVPLLLSDGSTVGTTAIANIVNAMAAYQAANPSFNPATASAMPTNATLVAALNSNWSRTIGAGAGDDTLNVSFGSDTVTAGPNDSITGGSGGNDSLVAGAGSETLVASTTGANTLVAGSGNDVIDLGTTASVVQIAPGDGTSLVQLFEAGTGGDVLEIGGANNTTVTVHGAGEEFLTYASGTLAVTTSSGSEDVLKRDIPTGWEVAGTGSFFSNGHDDIVWRDTATGDDAIWEMSASGYQYVQLPVVPTNWTLVGTGTFTGNGVSGLLWRDTTSDSSSGQVWVWTGNMASPTETLIGTVPVNWTLAGTGDFTGSGVTDLVWQDRTSDSTAGQVWVWLDQANLSAAQEVEIGTQSAAWSLIGTGDLTGNGIADLIWENSTTGQVQAWDMNGATVANTVSLGTIGSGWSLLGIGDFTGDGAADLAWELPNGTGVVWVDGQSSDTVALSSVASITGAIGAAGAGQFMNQGLGPEFLTYAAGTIAVTTADGTQDVLKSGIASGWEVAGTGNFYNDGHSDIVWRDTLTGDDAIWEMTGSGFQYVQLSIVPTNWTLVGTGTFTGNGMSGLLWRDTTSDASSGQVWVWTGNMASPTETQIGTVPLNWTLAGTGDFTGGGVTDLVWQDRTSDSTAGQVWVWLDQASLTSPQEVEIGTQSAAWSLIGTGDLTGNGVSDLVWLNSTTDQVQAWDMNGATVTGTVSLGTIGTGWSLLGIGDWVGDGKADLLWGLPNGTGVVWVDGQSTDTLTLSSVASITGAVGAAGEGHFVDGVSVSAGSGTVTDLIGPTAGNLSPASNIELTAATQSYAGASAPVSANLLTGAVSIGGVAQPSITAQSVTGSAFNDTLTAGTGNDTLAGGGGYDVYQFALGDGQSVIQNAAASNSGPSGELDFGAGIASDQLWLQQVGNNLQIDIMGTTSTMTVAGWYSASNAQLEHLVTTSDGSMLDTQLNNLVTAMAAYETAHPGFNPQAATNTQVTDPTLLATIASAWHH